MSLFPFRQSHSGRASAPRWRPCRMFQSVAVQLQARECTRWQNIVESLHELVRHVMDTPPISRNPRSSGMAYRLCPPWREHSVQRRS